jgi:hypothetical protein
MILDYAQLYENLTINVFARKQVGYWKKNTNAHTKIYTDGSKKEEKLGGGTNDKKNSIYSVEQTAIINAIYSTWKKEGPKVIITNSVNTRMAVSDRKRSKTQIIRKLMGEQWGIITLLWVPGNVDTTGNENADIAAKEALNKRIHSTEKYPSQAEKYPSQDLTK